MASIVRHGVVVHGRVQGVGFRISTRLRAEELSVTGWVRNRADGSVEAEVEGEPDAVDALLDWLHEGPPLADVTRVEVMDAAPQASSRFTVLD